MKKIIIILSAFVITVLCVIVGAYLYSKCTVSKIEMNEINISEIKDGQYKGAAEYTPVKARVSVTVKDGKILDIDLLEHQTGVGKKAEKVLTEIVNKQTLDVDAISGATQSSATLTKAVENALSGN